MEANEIRAAAGALFDQHRDRRDLTPIDPAVAPRTVDDAYRVQDALLGRWTQPPGHHVAGWKIALTTPVMQSFVGIDHPLAGAILSPRVHPSPARLAAEDYVNLGVESEIAVRIASDAGADGAPYDRERIAVHVAACMAATEVIDDRHCDYGHPDPPLLIADNAFNAGCVLGPERTDWRALDLTAARAHADRR